MRHLVITLCTLLLPAVAWAGEEALLDDVPELQAVKAPAETGGPGDELAPEGEGNEKEPVLMPVEAAVAILQCPVVSRCPETPATCAPGVCGIMDTGACSCANPPPGLTCPAGQTIHVQKCSCRCVSAVCSLNCVSSTQQTFFCL